MSSVLAVVTQTCTCVPNRTVIMGEEVVTGAAEFAQHTRVAAGGCLASRGDVTAQTKAET